MDRLWTYFIEVTKRSRIASQARGDTTRLRYGMADRPPPVSRHFTRFAQAEKVIEMQESDVG